MSYICFGAGRKLLCSDTKEADWHRGTKRARVEPDTGVENVGRKYATQSKVIAQLVSENLWVKWPLNSDVLSD